MEIGLAVHATTNDNKVFAAQVVVMVDTNNSDNIGSTQEQTILAMQLVTNHIHSFISSVSSAQISNDYRTFSKNLENSLRDQLASHKLSLKILLILNHRIEPNQ